MPALVLQLLTHHRTATLPALLTSLNMQTDKNWTLYWLDNGSTAAERQTMKRMLAEARPTFTVVSMESDQNIGFAGGHQQLYGRHNSDYVMLVNDDAILEPEYVARLRAMLDARGNVAAVTGTILRYDFVPDGTDGVRSGIWDVVKSNVIDSLGFGKTRYHKVYDIGAGGQIPDPRPDPIRFRPDPIWGVSGCLPMYRRAAVGQQLFDPSYFLYKEDVDLAYRLNKAGFAAMLVPGALAYHKRSFRNVWLGRPKGAQRLSYRNHWRNLRRHLTWKDWLKDGWLIIPYEAAKAVYMLIRWIGQ